MFTLHDTIELTKKAVIFTVIGAVIIIILILLFRFGVFLKNTFYPEAPPPPEVAFGKLPPIEFGKSEEQNFTYVIDTLSGELPVFPERVNVYELVQPYPEFFDYSRAKAKAQRLGLTTNPERINESIYQWAANTDLRPIFTINIVNNDFFYQTNYLTYDPIINAAKRPTTESAIEEAQSFLQSLNSFPDALNTASTSAVPYAIKEGNLIPATSQATTQAVRVDFYQQTVNRLPVYYPDYPSSLNYVIVAGGNSKDTVVEASYIYRQASETYSDYPIKTSKEAFSELQEQKAHVTSYFGTDTEIKITDVDLGYFIGPGEQQYLMPVFVFIGNDGEFTALVSAVQNDYIESE